MKLELFGIPTCDSCKKARGWLQQQSMTVEWRDLRAAPPGEDVIKSWVQGLGSKALRNTSGRSYRSLPEERSTWDDARWVQAFAADPMLIKRPILVRNGKAVAGIQSNRLGHASVAMGFEKAFCALRTA